LRMCLRGRKFVYLRRVKVEVLEVEGDRLGVWLVDECKEDLRGVGGFGMGKDCMIGDLLY
jgi:hypothetical protein